jgi:hypothetical protein
VIGTVAQVVINPITMAPYTYYEKKVRLVLIKGGKLPKLNFNKCLSVIASCPLHYYNLVF